MTDSAITPIEIEQFVRNSMLLDCAKFMESKQDPLISELRYWEGEIELNKEGIEVSTKYYNNSHRQDMRFLSEMVNFELRLKIAEEFIAKLTSSNNSKPLSINTGGLMNQHLKIEKTLTVNLNEAQIKKIHKLLIKEEYIKPINENDFVYFLTGQLLTEINKINWLKPKSQAYYFFHKICIGFSLKTLNSCISHKDGKIDSNTKPKIGYQLIDAMINDVKR